MFYNNKKTLSMGVEIIMHWPEPEHSFIGSEKDFAALKNRKKTYCYTQLIYYQKLMYDCY